MAAMDGYAVFDFKGPSVSGWAKGAELIKVLYDGRVVGEAAPGATTAELEARVPGSATFEVDVDLAFSALDVVSERLLAVAVAPTGEQFNLKLTDARRFDLAEQAVNEVLSTVPVAAREPIRQRAMTWPQVAADELARRMDRGEVSPQLVPANLRSPAGDVITGMHGHLYFVGADGALLDRYDADQVDLGADSSGGVLDEWATLFANRKQLANRYGAEYIHMVVPEKLTGLRRWAPLRVSGPTPLLAQFQRRFSGEQWLIDVLRMLDEWQHPEDPFLTTDSHLSAAAAQSLTSQLSDRVAPWIVPQLEALPLREVSYLQGDLAQLMQLPFYSRAMRPETALMRRYSAGLREVERSAEETRGHRGRMLHWVNSTAPGKLKVQIFGGAVVGEGDAPEQLAWWAKHFFQEVRVDWLREVDVAAVDAFQPDVILTQSLERDLSTVPVR